MHTLLQKSIHLSHLTQIFHFCTFYKKYIKLLPNGKLHEIIENFKVQLSFIYQLSQSTYKLIKNICDSQPMESDICRYCQRGLN